MLILIPGPLFKKYSYIIAYMYVSQGIHIIKKVQILYDTEMEPVLIHHFCPQETADFKKSRCLKLIFLN